MIEDKIDQLIAALDRNTAALAGGAAPQAADAKPAKPRKTKDPLEAGPPPAPPALTIDDVREKLKALPRERTAALLKRFSSDGKMSGVLPALYPDLLEAAEESAQEDSGDPLLG